MSTKRLELARKSAKKTWLYIATLDIQEINVYMREKHGLSCDEFFVDLDNQIAKIQKAQLELELGGKTPK